MLRLYTKTNKQKKEKKKPQITIFFKNPHQLFWKKTYMKKGSESDLHPKREKGKKNTRP